MVYLQGELGSGKTTLARGFLQALGVTGPVRSPTYTLVELYPAAGITLVHADLYRLRDPAELESLGLREWAAPGSPLARRVAGEGRRKAARTGPRAQLEHRLFRSRRRARGPRQPRAGVARATAGDCPRLAGLKYGPRRA